MKKLQYKKLGIIISDTKIFVKRYCYDAVADIGPTFGNGPHVIGNGPHVIGNGPHVIGNGPHVI